jgi:cytoskeletal protein CcmA (bactofilin family)
MTATTLPTSSIAGAVDRVPSESRIDADSHFNGLYETRQNLRIEGVAEGEIQCEGTLTVAEGARVKAKVTASTITIAGELQGEVVCRGIFQIMPSGEVEATVSARRLIVQEGGLYNGDFRMITEEAAERPIVTGATETRGRRRADRAPGAEADQAAPAADAAESTGSEAIGSDEWWAKISGRDAAAGGPSDNSKKPA